MLILIKFSEGYFNDLLFNLIFILQCQLNQL